MANKALTVETYIMRNNERIKFDDLSNEEKSKLTNKWNRTSMESAGYTTTYPLDKAV